MPRRKSVNFIREIGVDPRYSSELVQKLINVVMWRGKKNAARHIVYEAFEVLEKKVGGDKNKAVDLFLDAFENVIPKIEVRPRRVGGSVYQIPVAVEDRRARALGLRWLVGAAKVRNEKTMGQRLGRELLEAVENRGGAVKKRTDVHKMAEANRAFSHFAW
ncbi:MAG: 30S ribosomal protein S7 [Candidatus Babeliales bacterium]